MPGSGRPLKDKDFDDEIAAWVRDQRKKKLRVSRQMIQKEARKKAPLYFDEDDDAFKVISTIV